MGIGEELQFSESRRRSRNDSSLPCARIGHMSPLYKNSKSMIPNMDVGTMFSYQSGCFSSPKVQIHCLLAFSGFLPKPRTFSQGYSKVSFDF